MAPPSLTCGPALDLRKSEASPLCRAGSNLPAFHSAKAASSFRMPAADEWRAQEEDELQLRAPRDLGREGAPAAPREAEDWRPAGRGRVPPLQVTSLTKPPPELPAKLAAEYEADADDLGEGAFAIVRRLRRKDGGGLVALKVVEKYPLQIRNMLPQLQREVRIQGNLQHRHILRLLSCMEDEWYLYMLLEHCAGGSLRDLCAQQPENRLSEARAAWYFAQILQGVDFMHQKRYVHRDLKEENMLLTSDDEVRICDFGWSAEVKAERALRTTCGTPHYWPPEIFEGESQDTPVDLWALGTLVYELLVGHAPFWGSVEEIRRKVLSVDLRYPPQLLSNEAIQLFYFLLRRDPHSRTPARQLLEESVWVRQGLEEFKARGRPSHPARIGASTVDSTASRQKEVVAEDNAGRARSSVVVAPMIMCHGERHGATPGRSAVLSAALPSPSRWQDPWHQAAIPRPCLQALPNGKVVQPAFRFVGTAR